MGKNHPSARITSPRSFASAKKPAASEAKSEGVSPAQYQEMKIMSEVMARFKAQLAGQKASDPSTDENAFWPDREVHLGKEFPNLFQPVDQTALEKGTLSVVEKSTKEAKPLQGQQVEEDDEDIIDDEEADERDEDVERALHEDDDDAPAALVPPSIGEKVTPPAVKPIATEQEKNPLVDKKEKPGKIEELPPWAKRPIAASSLSFGLNKTISEKDLPNVETFDKLGVAKPLADAIASEWSITRPSEIQRLAIPEFAKGANMLIAAQTGTGKTLSYLLPLLEKLHMHAQSKAFKRRGQRTRALIIVPNRELGLQVLDVIGTITKRDARFSAYTTFLLAGGNDSFKKETQALTPGLDILVSTPERLVNHIETEHLHLDDLRAVIFDEADTLMSRKDAIENTLQFISFMKQSLKKRAVLTHVQHVFVSATVSKPLMDLLKQEYPNTVSVVSTSIHKSVPQLKQDFLYGSGGDFRFRLLLSTLQKRKVDGKTLIFFNSVHTCKEAFTRLQQKNFNVVMLHSDLDVKRRKRNYEEFMHGDARIMVATDIASRGLDLGSKVSHVILYEFPTNTIDYLHRIGRTARAGKDGLVTAFIGKNEQRLATLIKRTLESGRSLAEITPTVSKEKRNKNRQKEEIAEEYRAEWERSNPPPKDGKKPKKQPNQQQQKSSSKSKSKEYDDDLDYDDEEMEMLDDDKFNAAYEKELTKSQQATKQKQEKKLKQKQGRPDEQVGRDKKSSGASKSAAKLIQEELEDADDLDDEKFGVVYPAEPPMPYSKKKKATSGALKSGLKVKSSLKKKPSAAASAASAVAKKAKVE